MVIYVETAYAGTFFNCHPVTELTDVPKSVILTYKGNWPMSAKSLVCVIDNIVNRDLRCKNV